MQKFQKIWPKLALLLVAILWGTSLTVVKQAADVVPPFFILTLRFSLAGLLLSVVFWQRLRRAPFRTWKQGIIIGLTMFISFATQTLSVTLTTPGRSGFLSSSYCVLVPFLYWLLAKVRPDRFHLLAAVLCVSGIACVALSEAEGTVASPAPNPLLGDSLSLLCAVFFASHIVLIALLGRQEDPFVLTIVQFLTAAVLSLGASFVSEPLTTIAWNQRAVLEILYLAFFCTAVALLLQNLGQKYCEPSSASIILGLESVFGVIFPVVLGLERLHLLAVCGFALIFSAILISETKLKFPWLQRATSALRSK